MAQVYPQLLPNEMPIEAVQVQGSTVTVTVTVALTVTISELGSVHQHRYRLKGRIGGRSPLNFSDLVRVKPLIRPFTTEKSSSPLNFSDLVRVKPLIRPFTAGAGGDHFCAQRVVALCAQSHRHHRTHAELRQRRQPCEPIAPTFHDLTPSSPPPHPLITLAPGNPGCSRRWYLRVSL
eukprot:607575-Prorocentrum_minimum.AAC.1